MQTPQFSIRPATSEDIRQILEIENHVHPAPWSASHFEEELTKPYSQFLVMTDDETDEIIGGYIVYWQMEGGDCEILNLAVDLPQRGKGFARRLVLQAVSAAVKAGAKKVILDVRKSNMPAIQLYQSLRFTITQLRKRFYSNGEDAYGMTLSLEGGEVEPGQGVEF